MIEMTGLGPNPRGVSGSGSNHKDSPEKIQAAASQFEALLVAQMLKQIREADSDGLAGEQEDKSADHLMGFAEEQLAQVLSAQGGLGIARMAAESMTPPKPAATK